MKIIVRSPNWVGDCVLSLPFLQVLREKHPQDHITVLARDPGAALFEGNPFIDKVETYKSFLSALGGVRAESYDEGYVLPNSLGSALLFRLGGVRRRVGYADEGRSALLSDAVPWKGETEPRVVRYVRLADPAAPVPDITPRTHPASIRLDAAAEKEAETLTKDSAGRARIALNPCANAVSRRWSAERYGALAQRLIDAGADVFLVGSPAPSDQELTGRVRKACKSPRLRDVSGKTSLKGAAALLKRMDALVTNDTGTMHVAAAVGVPIVDLVGAADVNVTGPWTETPFLAVDKHVPCSPCVENVCFNRETPMLCMNSIEVEDAFTAVKSLLKGKL